MSGPPRKTGDDFENFRRKRKQRKRRAAIAGVDGKPLPRGAREEVEREAQREAQDMQMRREILDFVRETTKHAADVIGEMEEEHADAVSEKVANEMQEFLETASGETADLMELLKQRHDPDDPSPGVEDLFEVDTAPPPAKSTPEAPDAAHLFEAQAPEDEPSEAPADLLGGALVVESMDQTAEIEGEVLSDPLEIEGLENLEAESPTGEVPAAYCRLLEDPDTAKKTLTVLVKAGLLTREEARDVFKQVQEKRVS